MSSRTSASGTGTSTSRHGASCSGTRPTPGTSASTRRRRGREAGGLPPTCIDVGELDLFRDEDIRFAARLLEAGVPVDLHVYPGGVHAGELLAPDAELSRRIGRYRDEALGRALATDRPKAPAPDPM
ncbi:alpha/beta hydrolase [Streptomyces sp. 24-1644]|uniref:alpha/beta hydrolase n=1 Tax=Streptomyces sp. 24-1644 TaxID=3457315 RepID=UPI003FA73F8F